MKKYLITLLLAACLSLGTAGCVVTTTGEASWEAYIGIRTRQHSEEPSKVEIQSSVVDKIADSLTDGEVSEVE